MTDPGGVDSAGAASVDLVEFLHGAGVDDRLIDEAVAQGADGLHRLAYSVALLGGPALYTPPEVWVRTDSDEALARDMWRAMGFASIPDDSRALTEMDLVALRRIDEFLGDQGGSREAAIRFTRVLGQAMSRVSDALTSVIEDAVASNEIGLDSDTGAAEVGVLASLAVVPLVEGELQYLFRRHMYASAVGRLVASDDGHAEVVVGFADVVQFTRLSGQMDESQLAELLETFEAETSDLIANRGGRVIKLIGDAVMFTVDDDVAAGELALEMVEAFSSDDRPDLRVGLAHGEVIARQGDVFGPTVNLASRLVGYARPGAVLIDASLAEHLADEDRFGLRSLGRHNLKGIGRTAISVLRRA